MLECLPSLWLLKLIREIFNIYFAVTQLIFSENFCFMVGYELFVQLIFFCIACLQLDNYYHDHAFACLMQLLTYLLLIGRDHLAVVDA